MVVPVFTTTRRVSERSERDLAPFQTAVRASARMEASGRPARPAMQGVKMVKERSMRRHPSRWSAPMLDVPRTGCAPWREAIQRGEGA